jgi:hypothetical protein
MHSVAVHAIRLWLAQGYELWAGHKPEPSMPLFPGLDGDYSRTDAAVHIRQDLRATGLPNKVEGRNVDFHATRRSCATWLEELGANDTHRKRLMGHSIQDVTDKNYTRKTRELLVQLRETVELIPLRWSSTLVRIIGAPAPSESDSSRNSAPPRRLERPTNGLGSGLAREIDAKTSELEGEAAGLDQPGLAGTSGPCLLAVSLGRPWFLSVAELGPGLVRAAMELPEAVDYPELGMQRPIDRLVAVAGA